MVLLKSAHSHTVTVHIYFVITPVQACVDVSDFMTACYVTPYIVLYIQAVINL